VLKGQLEPLALPVLSVRKDLRVTLDQLVHKAIRVQQVLLALKDRKVIRGQQVLLARKVHKAISAQQALLAR
jgi:hypothetical protein